MGTPEDRQVVRAMLLCARERLRRSSRFRPGIEEQAERDRSLPGEEGPDYSALDSAWPEARKNPGRFTVERRRT